MGGQVLVLDGGMGTTLEQLGVDVSSSLWGSDLLLGDPAPIATVHRGYVDAGADLIESATYPLSVEGIQREYPGKTVDEAEVILHRGLQLALDSASSSSTSSSGSSSSGSLTRSAVVPALGPLGATLKPGAEYSGLYPPPYGFGTVLDRNPTPTNVAPTDEAEKGPKEALYHFHLSRLQAYARSPAWSQVGWVGFETIPLVRGVRAIRRAIRDFRRRGEGGTVSDRRDAKDKGPKFWIACTFPDGHAPQPDSTVAQTVRALLEPAPAVGGGAEGERDVEGVGINCTNPAWLPGLIDTFNQTLLALSSPSTATDAPAAPSPWFVLYPDGGQVYDPLTRSWSKELLSAEEWAERMMAAVRQVDASGLWAGVIAGGCCKTSADEIRELRKRVDQYRQDK